MCFFDKFSWVVKINRRSLTLNPHQSNVYKQNKRKSQFDNDDKFVEFFDLRIQWIELNQHQIHFFFSTTILITTIIKFVTKTPIFYNLKKTIHTTKKTIKIKQTDKTRQIVISDNAICSKNWKKQKQNDNVEKKTRKKKRQNFEFFCRFLNNSNQYYLFNYIYFFKQKLKVSIFFEIDFIFS